MVVVVTGAAGFIGMHLVGALRQAGHQVVGIDRRRSTPKPGYVPLAVDLLDRDEDADQALRTADIVYHLAGRPGVRDSSPQIDYWRYRDNVVTTARVLGLVPPSVPLVVASSSSVYGGSTDGRPCREHDPLRPRGGYAASKVQLETLCASRAEAGGRVIVCRPFTVAGEGQRPDMALAQWINAVAADQPIRLLGSLQRSRDITDVRDVAAALMQLAHCGRSGTVNIGTGQGHSLAAMVAAVGQVLGRDPSVQVGPAPDDDPPATLADVSRLTQLTGLAPRTDLLALVERQAGAALGARGSNGLRRVTAV